MFDTFKAKAEAAGNTAVHRVATKADALDFIVELLKKEGINDVAGSWAVWADSPILTGVDTSALAARVPGMKVGVTLELAKNAKIGITQMDWGIANTGTLAQDSTKADQRMASALPWIHLAILGTNSIVADMRALMTKMHPNKNTYIALITGPSKTADIERVLAIGVHGPERVVILCVDDLFGTN
ncbi:MAG: lactate utilization protein [Nitrospirota bacterium]